MTDVRAGQSPRQAKPAQARNAETHGMYGRHVVLASDSREASEAIKAGTIAHYEPANDQELEIVTGLIDARAITKRSPPHRQRSPRKR